MGRMMLKKEHEMVGDMQLSHVLNLDSFPYSFIHTCSMFCFQRNRKQFSSRSMDQSIIPQRKKEKKKKRKKEKKKKRKKEKKKKRKKERTVTIGQFSKIDDHGGAAVRRHR
jgi:hypothetical protein